MNQHPYIGRTFRLDMVKLGKRIVFEKAICVHIVDHGAGIFRLPDNSHISTHLTEVVGPLDEPAPAVATREKWETVTLPYWDRPVDLPDSSAVEVGAWRPLATGVIEYRAETGFPPDLVIVWTRRLLFAVEGA